MKLSKKLYYLLFILICLPSTVSAERLSITTQKSTSADQLWLLISAALVFFMQAGFKALESGMVKAKHKDGISVKNLIDFIIGGTAFYLVGFGLMFGESFHGLFGINFFMLSGLVSNTDFSVDGILFFLFQLGFVGTSLTIISGAMSGRTGLLSYLLSSLITACLVYPIYGHWAWGNMFLSNNQAWLADLGFMDFAGSTVVHSIGAWISLVGIWLVGPRIGRFDQNGIPIPFQPSSYSYSILGAMILWLGWWGFNGGSLYRLDNQVGSILLNTNLSGIAAALSAFIHVYFSKNRSALIEKTLGGLLTGLVAITACCNIVDHQNAFIIGLIAGVLHNLSYDFILLKLKLDDAVGAVSIHGIGGVFGTICVALFGNQELLIHDRWLQLGIQVFGVSIAFVFAGSMALLTFYFIQKFIGLRVDPVAEVSGKFWGLDAGSSTEININDLNNLSNTLSNKAEVAFISIKMQEGNFNLKSVEEYLNIPSKERYKMVEADKVQYWDKEGTPIDKLWAVRQLGKKIERQKSDLIKERDKVSAENKNVTDSIKYARRIQKAVVPSEEDILDILPQHFILNMPRDIVSGDFYWATEKHEKKIIAIADCTGHGVPGAFLSMMGVAFLNEIVQKKIPSAHIILNKLRTKVKNALHQTSEESEAKDGMNISLIIIDTANSTIEFAGAYHPLIITRKNPMTHEIELHEYKSDRMPIGISRKDSNSFTKFNIPIIEGDEVYTFSDGYTDQFGGSNNRRMSIKQMKRLLTNIHGNSMGEQKKYLKKHLEEWKGDHIQIDDILVLGFKL